MFSVSSFILWRVNAADSFLLGNVLTKKHTVHVSLVQLCQWLIISLYYAKKGNVICVSQTSLKLMDSLTGKEQGRALVKALCGLSRHYRIYGQSL